ncbi:hypothetical protein AMECASPLE_023532 [Ameca splendens]|uniref:Uncharacterized protein n=1 Tax=Ameca splendens TaxID=208324 RepID=A0ABV0XT00_9TELE
MLPPQHPIDPAGTSKYYAGNTKLGQPLCVCTTPKNAASNGHKSSSRPRGSGKDPDPEGLKGLKLRIGGPHRDSIILQVLTRLPSSSSFPLASPRLPEHG